MCLVLSDVYWHVPYSDEIDAETGSVEWMYDGARYLDSVRLVLEKYKRTFPSKRHFNFFLKKLEEILCVEWRFLFVKAYDDCSLNFMHPVEFENK